MNNQPMNFAADGPEARYNGNMYYFETVCDKVNRQDASQLCSKRGGWLAELNDDMSEEIKDLGYAIFIAFSLIKEIHRCFRIEKSDPLFSLTSRHAKIQSSLASRVVTFERKTT